MVGTSATVPDQEVWCAHIPMTTGPLSITHLSPGGSSQMSQLESQALAVLWQGEGGPVGAGRSVVRGFC